jgi:hypothetical protein
MQFFTNLSRAKHITEANWIHLVPSGMQNRTFGPYLACQGQD